MHHIQAVVDRARMFVMNDTYDDTPELRATVEEFQDVIRKLNGRLQRCGEYLRQGLRAEAIREAEADPRLLDAVAIVESLTDEERGTWRDLCGFLELPFTDRILTDVAAMIDEAYLEHAPLESLLRTHRLLAIQRAPLSQRLGIVRQLAELDPNTEFWRQDVLSYEEARLSQIRNELHALRKDPSSRAISMIVKELRSTDWQTAVPRKLVAAAMDLQKTVRRDEARLTLQSAEETLRAAHSEMNPDLAASAYQAWIECLPLAEYDDTEPVVLQAMPALAWYEQELARADAERSWQDFVMRIERTLDDPDISHSDLELLANEEIQHGRPLPTQLHNRFRNRLAAAHLQQRRRRLLVVGSATVLSICLIAALTALYLRATDNTQRQETIARIDSLTQQGAIGESQRLVEEFQNRWSNSSDWQEMERRIEGMRVQLEERTARVDQVLLDAAATVDTDIVRFKQLQQDALSIAGKEPVIDSEVLRVQQRFAALSQERANRVKAFESALNERLSAQSSMLIEIEKELQGLERGDFNARTKRIEDALSLLKSESVGYSVHLGEAVALLQSNLQDVRSQFARHLRRGEVRQELQRNSRTNLFGSESTIKKYISLLEEYAGLGPSQDLVQQTRATLGETVHWEAISSFSSVFPLVGDPFPSNGDVLKSRLEQVTSLLNQVHVDPLRQDLLEYQRLLKILVARVNGPDSILATTRKRVVDRPEMHLYTIEEFASSVPYLYVESPSVIEPRSQVAIVPAWGVNGNRQKKIRATATIVPKASPQSRLASELAVQLNAIDGVNSWESAFAKMSDHAAAATAVDPILRLEVLYHLYDQMRKGSVVLENHAPFEEYSSLIEEAKSQVGLGTVDWGDPEDKEVARRREIAAKFLAEAVRPQHTATACWIAAPVSLDKSRTRLSQKYRSVGWMTVDMDGTKRIDIESPGVGQWNLYVTVPLADSEQAAILQRIGTVSNGEIALDETATGVHFQFGRLVYAERQS